MVGKRKLNILVALIPILVLLVSGAMSVFVWKIGMIIPLLSGILATAVIGLFYGQKWNDLEAGIKDGVFNTLQPIFILIIVGAIIGTWISSGIIPALIYYGLKFIQPSIFIPLTAIITAIVATSTGTSFTSIATVGIALMAVGNGMGFPPALTAAAVISGAFFGDKLSPLSDTTNIAPAMAGCKLFEHVGHMLWDTIPAFIVSLVLFWFVSLGSIDQGLSGTEQIKILVEGLEGLFNLNPLLLLLPIITIVLAILKIPAIPSLISVSILGGLFSVLFQGNSVVEVMNHFTFGFQADSGIDMLDSLLSKGGINSMGNTIILLTTASALGGIMQKVGILNTILSKIMNLISNSKQLLIATLISSFLIGFGTGAQILAIIIPASMFSPSFKKMGIHTKNLSRAVEAAGTVGITLVPWSVPAIFASNMLGVNPIDFIPYLFFPMLIIVFNIIYSLTGFSITKVDKKEEVFDKAI